MKSKVGHDQGREGKQHSEPDIRIPHELADSIVPLPARSTVAGRAHSCRTGRGRRPLRIPLTPQDVEGGCGVNKLTQRQSRFVAEYLVDLNAKQAAIRAG